MVPDRICAGCMRLGIWRQEIAIVGSVGVISGVVPIITSKTL